MRTKTACFTQYPGKIIGIGVTGFCGHFFNRKIRLLEQFHGVAYTAAAEINGRRHSVSHCEGAEKRGAMYPHILSDGFHTKQRIGKIGINALTTFLNAGRVVFVRIGSQTLSGVQKNGLCNLGGATISRNRSRPHLLLEGSKKFNRARRCRLLPISQSHCLHPTSACRMIKSEPVNFPARHRTKIMKFPGKQHEDSVGPYPAFGAVEFPDPGFRPENLGERFKLRRPHGFSGSTVGLSDGTNSQRQVGRRLRIKTEPVFHCRG